MLQKPTAEAAKVISYSETVARGYGHIRINTEHLLLSMLIHGERAQEVLSETYAVGSRKKGIDIIRLKELVETRLTRLSNEALPRKERVGFVPRTYHLLGRAMELSLDLNMANEGSDSILLAMLDDTTSFAGQDLATVGTTSTGALKAVLDLYGPQGSRRPAS